ncbi:hypothetical protein WN55_01190 [Dufourea novaeangliae]|uniref:Uncharacterized protein n=1 Tax=Dufourea novaeangliae TaxID=178035 RepID=A0A154PEF8_DUFNO|nr:hypothetical protein WN55_01190 [Dufourea novaeangliae]
MKILHSRRRQRITMEPREIIRRNFAGKVSFKLDEENEGTAVTHREFPVLRTTTWILLRILISFFVLFHAHNSL